MANGGLTTIVFSADAPGTGYGPVIDRVSASLVTLPAPVPAPATWAMLLLGFGIVGAAMHKRPAVHRQTVTFRYA